MQTGQVEGIKELIQQASAENKAAFEQSQAAKVENANQQQGSAKEPEKAVNVDVINNSPLGDVAAESERVRIEAEAAAQKQPDRKSFDEEFAERFKGKTIAEIELALTPKEEVKYRNQILEKLIELDKKGVDIDEDFIALQTKDYKSIKDSDQILLEEYKLNKDYKDWTDRELKILIDKKYNRKSWAEEGEEKSDDEILERKMYGQDVSKAQEALIQKQESYSLKQKQLTPVEIEQAQNKERKDQLEWETNIEKNVLANGSKLSRIVDDKTKETFDIEISDTDKNWAGKILKDSRTDINAFWDVFRDDKGQIDLPSVFDVLITHKNKNNHAASMAKAYRAKGGEDEFNKIKNIDFQLDGTKINRTSTVDEKNAEKINAALGRQK